MDLELLVSVVAAAATAVLGLIASFLARKEEHIKREQVEEAEELAAAVTAHAEERRARALELLAEKLPDAGSAVDLLGKLESFSTLNQLTFLRNHTGLEKPDQSWALVQDLVNGYHRQALAQARVQFWFSIVAATVGFSLIIYMIATAPDAEALTLVARTLPGVAIDAVAALFFRQAGETRERATALYDRLRTDNQRTQALSLVNSIDAVDVRNAVKAELAMHMAGLSSSQLSTILPQLLRVQSPNKPSEP